ncbi:hypothetical protein RBH26_20120 [Natronolimnohabitans sp. A-GB9]|uniref:hypothetical protein n=1 Tax=Natronolimnohabitans sp. A-GB9 TaxID=3069757 RepID=UPI0027B6CED0|nr:hypothetical protein [Natronolimnohabitans sp. A-GB9]MDQ2052752.1 hypothetical protein [Natronolimnohabitans sp. A-GB9]
MAVNPVGGLPNRPLTRSDIHALTGHPKIDICHPVYQLVNDEDAIISVFLGVGEQVHVLIFDPEKRAWEKVDSTGSWEGLTEDVGLDDDRLTEQLDAGYDEDEIEPAGYLNDPLEGFAENLPQEPLTAAQITAISDREFIPEAIPFTRHQSNDRYVSFVLAFDEPIESRRLFAAYGYNPEMGTWEVAHSLDVTDVDRDDEGVFETLAEHITSWITDHYELSELAIDEEEAS